AKTPKEKLTFGTTFSDHLLEIDWDKNSGWGAPLIRYRRIYTSNAIIQPFIGVGASSKAKVYVILSPVGPYYPVTTAPRSCLKWKRPKKVTRKYARNSLVYIKFCGSLAKITWSLKYVLALWPPFLLTSGLQAGTMNLFVFWINEQGEKELVTAPLTRGDILPGVTRQSILEMTRGWGEFKVTEHTITMPAIVKAQQEGRLLEVFGSGTAAVISPVQLINYNGKDVNVPLDAPDGKSGQLTKRIWNEMTDIQNFLRSGHKDMAMASMVLHSPELLRCICVYQVGIYQDMIPFCQLKPRVDSRKIYPTEFEEVDAVVSRWYAQHGIGRLDQLLACMERMRLVVFAHAIIYGRQDVLDHLNDRYRFVHVDHQFPISLAPLDKPTQVYKWKDSFVLAAHHGHVSSLEFLHINNHKRPSDTAAWFVAAANGHVDILRYLHAHEVEGWRHSILEGAIKHGQLEVVQWIYENRSDMRSLAVVNQALGVALEHRQLKVANYLNQLWLVKLQR
ncbi:hypothetical protein DYB32_000942, partial [Aphanomyces invadans]